MTMQAKLSRWRQPAAAVMVSLSFVEIATADPQPGPATAHPPATVEALGQRLEQRDALVDDLQRRVKELERQLATLTGERARPAAGKSVARPAPTPPVAAAEPAAAKPAEKPPAPRAGAPAAPGQFEVDAEAAERALERTLVRTGARLLPFGQGEIQPSFIYVRSEQDTPVFFSDGTNQFVASQAIRSNIFIGDLLLRFGLPLDSQVELGLPYRYVDQEAVTEVGLAPRARDSTHGSGLGDFRLAVAKTLLREDGWQPDLVGRVTWDSASGDRIAGGIPLGFGFDEFELSLTATKRQDPLVFLGRAAYETTLEKDKVKPGDKYGFSVGAFLAASPETSLRFTLDQVFINDEQVDGKSLQGSDRTLGALVLGASSILGRGLFLDVTAGMGLTDDAPDYSIGVALSWRFDYPTHF